MSEKTLFLTLKKKWFDQILFGFKKIEYREKKAFWVKRIDGKIYKTIHFTNGYGKKAPYMIVEFLEVSLCEWEGKPVYGIKLGKILEKGNLK